jgi:lysozyme family protein
MKTTDGIINDVLKREGGDVNDPVDTGGPTRFGISKNNNPDAWRNGPPSEAAARDIYQKKYVIGPGFDKIRDVALQAQLVDFGVNSGPAVAVMKLQGILHVTQDGVLGPETLAALSAHHPDDVNTSLVAERVKMICKLVQQNPSQVKFLLGWCSRALEFL